MNKIISTIVLTLCFFSSFVQADIQRISVSSSGEQGNFISGIHGIGNESVSADGRYVAFTSEASNLVIGDTNGIRDVFVHDRNTGITERVSVSSSGGQALTGLFNPNGSANPSISANGRYVAFSSDANNLIPNDINGDVSDVFFHDRQTGTTELVSFSQIGEQRTYGSSRPSMSADGRFITYQTGQIYLFDRMTNVTIRLSRSPTGKLADGSSGSPAISADGHFVAYVSYANNLVSDCTVQTQIFVFDRITGVNECVSRSSNGVQGDYFSDHPSISADGRFVSYSSQASNLTPTDLNGNVPDIFVHDRQTDVTELVSVTSTGEQGNISGNFSLESSISADGRFVVFDNVSTNLSPGGTDRFSLAFVRDRQAGLTELVSKSASGEQANYFTNSPAISPDGKTIVFASDATNLVSGDTNSYFDVFATDNPLVSTDNDLITVEKLINNETRETQDSAAKLSTGTLYRQSYKVTNDSLDRIYQVRVFENGNRVCNFFSLDPGQTRQRCDTFKIVLDGEQHVQVNVSAKVSGSGEALSSVTDAYYTGLNGNGELRVTHRINNVNADSPDQAQTLGSSPATVSYKIENTGEIELYQVKAYHDPVSPVNSGWALQCVLGPLKPGQVRYCKRDIAITEPGLNQAMGRVQGRNAIRSATDVVNASNSTYFIVP